VAHESLLKYQENDEDTIYDYVAKEDGSGWEHWRERVHRWAYPKHHARPRFTQLTIPTTESVRYQYLLSLTQASGKVSQCIGVCRLFSCTVLLAWVVWEMAACSDDSSYFACAILPKDKIHDSLESSFTGKFDHDLQSYIDWYC